MSACDILVIANLNMDLILEQKNSQQTSRKRYADSFTLSPGGNGYNEAVAAARMGATVALAGMIGSDSFGAQLKASLNEEITDSHLVLASAAAAAPEGDWHHDGAGDQREGE